MVTENTIPVGEFYETPNGNIYFKVSKDASVYIRNREHTQTDTSKFLKISVTLSSNCKKISPFEAAVLSLPRTGRYSVSDEQPSMVPRSRDSEK